jgi:DNA gyrase subunit A
MRLRTLTGLEREKIQSEYNQLMAEIAELKAILADHNKLLVVIRDEIQEIADKYGDERRTSIGFDEYDISMEDLIPDKNTIITFTKVGYIKRMSPDNFKAQHRGGKGIKGMETLDDDYIVEMMMTTTHHYLLFFTNMGRVYRLKAYEIPEASRTAKGTAIVNLLQLQPEEKITSMISMKEMDDSSYLLMATKRGIVKRTKLSAYQNIRKTGLMAIRLREDDDLIGVKKTSGEEDIMLFTEFGQCIRFNEQDVRSTGRDSMGVIGMSLADQDQVIEMQQADDEQSLMIVSKKGLGKCTLTTEFTTQKRGGKGVKCYKILEKTGNLVGVQSVGKEDEMMLITTEGTVIQIKVADTALSGRVTSGVKLINLNDGVEVASIAKVRRDENMDTDEDVIENEEELEETTDNNSEAQVSTVQEDN